MKLWFMFPKCSTSFERNRTKENNFNLKVVMRGKYLGDLSELSEYQMS